MSTQPSMLEYALHYATQLGWPVFPLSPGSKIGFKGSNGHKDATTDPEKIRQWWTQHPNANIGFATGDIPGVLVVDVDVKNDVDGHASLPPMPSDVTLASRTPSGGVHYLFQNVPGYPNRAGMLPGVDVRANGGYIVLPPSILTADPTRNQVGGSYAWVGNGASRVSPLPEALHKIMLETAPQRQLPPSASRREQDLTLYNMDDNRLPAETEKRAADWLINHATKAVQGSGGTPLYGACIALASGFAMEEDAVLHCILEYYNPECDPPWDMRNAEHRNNMHRTVNRACSSIEVTGNHLTLDERKHVGLPVATDDLFRKLDEAAIVPPGAPTPSAEPYKEQTMDEWVASALASGFPKNLLEQALADESRSLIKVIMELMKRPRETLTGRTVFDDREPLPAPPAALLPGILFEGQTTILYGPRNCGKSFLAVDIATTVASGRPWMGIGQPKKPRKVVYMSFEDHGGVQERINGCYLAGKYPAGCDNIVVMHPVIYRTKFSKGDQPADKTALWLQCVAVATHEPELLIIDTWAKATAGGDENDASKSGEYLERAEAVRMLVPNCAVLIVHHTGKDQTKGGRGSGVICDSAANELMIRPRKPKDFIKGVSPAEFEVEIPKSRRTRKGADFFGRVIEVPRTFRGAPVLDTEGVPVTTAVVEYFTPENEEESDDTRVAQQTPIDQFAGMELPNKAHRMLRDYILAAGGPGVATLDDVRALYAADNHSVKDTTIVDYAARFPEGMRLKVHNGVFFFTNHALSVLNIRQFHE